MNISIVTLGCKVNQAESAAIEGAFRNLGFSIVGLSENPDYCIINTCTVTAKSDYQSRQFIRRAAKAGAKVIVTGCYAQLRPDELKGIAGVDRIVPNSSKSSIPNMLTGNTSTNTLCLSNRARPLVKVQDGCNHVCSYCVIPKARGRSKSVPIAEVIDQVLYHEANGYQEVVLTGIHLGLYGHDREVGITLSTLIQSLLMKTNIRRIRLSSIEVTEMNDEIMELLQEKRLCKHLHAPLQSGSDIILRSMKRPYTARTFSTMIERIANQVNGISIGTDVIVGFPGENDTEFMKTRGLLAALPITYMHIFPFSSRPGTLAAQMTCHISSPVKKERCNELNALNIRLKSAYLTSQVGKNLDIIIEETHGDSTSVGKSGNYLKVEASSNVYPAKSLVTVRIAGVAGDCLKGHPIPSP
jgi:threonylcarbamoyladenosine tRNA methylthiotransferase MtaB